MQIADNRTPLEADEQLKEAYVMDNVDLEYKLYEQSKKDKQKYGSAFIKELIKQGQSKEKIIHFLIQVMEISKVEANMYYQEVVADWSKTKPANRTLITLGRASLLFKKGRNVGWMT